MIILLCMGLAFGNELLLRIAISDTDMQALREPFVRVNGIEVPLFDDGSVAGDLANDQIYVTTTFIQRSQSVSLELIQQ